MHDVAILWTLDLILLASISFLLGFILAWFLRARLVLKQHQRTKKAHPGSNDPPADRPPIW